MTWSLAIVAFALIAVAAVSGRLSGTSLTATMIFVGIGLVVGPRALDGIDIESTGSIVRTLAEATLALVLFADASRIDLGQLRRSVGIPARLLGIGLPLTIALGSVVAALIFHQLTLSEAAILGVILAPTDAALGQAVVTEPRVPAPIRQGLNVESGLNDGICVPLLFVAVAIADVESNIAGGRSAITLLSEELGYGVLAGLVAGALVALILVQAGRRGLIESHWKQVIPAAGAVLAYGIADGLGGSGFIAAFVAGIAFRALLGRDPEELNGLTEEIGNLLNGVTFLIFGAILLGPAIGGLTWELALYAVLSLTLVRMVPVAVAMLGAHARVPTVGFVGWFGPRCLASIVFAVIVVEESHLPHEKLITSAIYLTIGLSVFAHGISAAPLSRRYAGWLESHRSGKAPPTESSKAEVTRPRGPSGRGPGPGLGGPRT
jgi:NhaP-type Na+/H+ or K+/H+ antiporter